MVFSEKLTEEARKLEGIKWGWRGWKPQHGSASRLDCLFATFWILSRVGIVEHNGAGYNYYAPTSGVDEEENRAWKFLTTLLHTTVPDKPQAGDIVVFRAGRQSSHIGVLTDEGIAHVICGRKFSIDPVKAWQQYIFGYLRVTNPVYKNKPSTIEIDNL